MEDDGKLNTRQKKFADEYIITGVAETAALKAGYSKNYSRARASELLANVGIQNYIKERNKELESIKIADMTEVKEFWTGVIRNSDAELKDRLKASEYIAKTNAAFSDKVEHSGNIGTTINIIPASKVKKDG